MQKLSIIVPVYNVEQYLAKCIDSLLKQDLASEDYEIILVDDGSTDGSGRIADVEGLRIKERGLRKLAYTKPLTEYINCNEGDNKTPRIRVIHQPNMGLSAARNAGLKIAEGKYVQYVDSDDFLEPNVLGGLVRQMEEQELDVLRFTYQLVHTHTGQYEVYWPFKRPQIVDHSTNVTDGETYLNTRMDMACFAWQFMLKRELAEKGLFTEGMYYEDVDWMPRMMLQAHRVSATDKKVYNYLQREGSITKAIDEQIRKKELDTKLQLLSIVQKIKAEGKATIWCENIITEMVVSMYEVICSRCWDKHTHYIQAIAESNVLPTHTNHPDPRRNRKARLINKYPNAYTHIMHWLNRIR